MADHESLPRPYLEQLVVSLREAGLVVSTRGAHGGYELSRPPALIRMGEVVTALEGPVVPMICASQDPHPTVTCDRVGYCTIDRLWQRVRDAVVRALDSMSLDELAQPRLGHPAHPGPPAPPEAVLVAVRPLAPRATKESIAQP
jgi:Rrf2 family protein